MFRCPSDQQQSSQYLAAWSLRQCEWNMRRQALKSGSSTAVSVSVLSEAMSVPRHQELRLVGVPDWWRAFGGGLMVAWGVREARKRPASPLPLWVLQVDEWALRVKLLGGLEGLTSPRPRLCDCRCMWTGPTPASSWTSTGWNPRLLTGTARRHKVRRYGCWWARSLTGRHGVYLHGYWWAWHAGVRCTAGGHWLARYAGTRCAASLCSALQWSGTSAAALCTLPECPGLFCAHRSFCVQGAHVGLRRTTHAQVPCNSCCFPACADISNTASVYKFSAVPEACMSYRCAQKILAGAGAGCHTGCAARCR